MGRGSLRCALTCTVLLSESSRDGLKLILCPFLYLGSPVCTYLRRTTPRNVIYPNYMYRKASLEMVDRDFDCAILCVDLESAEQGTERVRRHERSLNVLDLSVNHTEELQVCFSECKGIGLEKLQTRCKCALERLTLEDVGRSGEIWFHISAVCDALQGALDSAIAQQADFAHLRAVIYQRAIKDATPPKGELHFGAALRRCSSEAFAKYVRNAMMAINGLAAEQDDVCKQ